MVQEVANSVDILVLFLLSLPELFEEFAVVAGPEDGLSVVRVAGARVVGGGPRGPLLYTHLLVLDVQLYTGHRTQVSYRTGRMCTK